MQSTGGEKLLGREIRVDYAPDSQKTPKLLRKDKGAAAKGEGGSRWMQTKHDVKERAEAKRKNEGAIGDFTGQKVTF